MHGERQDEPTWVAPGRYGYAEALQSAGLIVAPLLAGFTITLIGLLVDTSSAGIRYRAPALLILAGAVGALLAAIQFAYEARQFAVTPAEMLAWTPTLGGAQNEEDAGTRWRLLVEQHAHHDMYRLWSRRFRFAYHLGVLLLLAGLVLVLVPSDGSSATRWAAVAVAGLVAIAEGLWILAIVLVAPKKPGSDEKRLRRCTRWLASHFPLRRPVEWLTPSYPDALVEAEKAILKRHSSS